MYFIALNQRSHESSGGGKSNIAAIDKSVTLTADYQLIANPAYNADRGPVSIFSGRVHAEF